MTEHTFIKAMRRIAAIGTCAMAYLLATPSAAAADESTLLIINSYNEFAPWSQSMTHPVTFHLAQIESVHCEIENLNNILVRDSVEYTQVVEHLFDKYRENSPEYVVMIGQMASTLFPRIKKEWGDVPILFISRSDAYGPKEYYYANFNGKNSQADYKKFKPFEDLRKEYNFTIVYDRDFYKQTIDLMDQMMDAMDSLVYISDAVAVNRILNNKIKDYLAEFYPNVHYQWLQAKDANSDMLRQYITNRAPKTGLLLSSWFYPVLGAQGYELPSNGEINIMSGSINPIFTLRENNMQRGALGGVFPSYENICKNIVYVLNAMLEGKSMRDLPVFDNLSSSPKINYPELVSYGFSERKCPEDTLFVDMPITFWDKYLWQVIVIVLLVIIATILLLGKNADQRRRIRVLERHKKFIEAMPVPFTKAKVTIKDGAIENVKYELMNDSYSLMVAENSSNPGKPSFFQDKEITAHIREAFKTRKPVKFEHTFERTGKVYDFLFCVIDYNGDKRQSDELDVFAIDITERSEMENQLKELTRRYDKTINAANVIPWQWNLADDTMVVDAYSLFQRYDRDLDNLDDYHESVMSAKDFISAVYEEDVPKLVEVRNKFLANEIKEFNLEYRIKLARGGKQIMEWVAVTGVVSERDEKGMPTEVIGSMQLISHD